MKLSKLNCLRWYSDDDLWWLLGRLPGPLLKSSLSLMEKVLTTLAKSVLITLQLQ